ncbi:MAG: DUF3034 family protein [Betaproteobacteria bacterium]
MFLAWFANKHFALTAAYLDLGRIADKPNQHALYVSFQLGF